LLASADSAFVAETTQQLTGYGFRVDAVGTGAEALKRCEDVDALLLDLVLPDADGFEVCRAVRSFSPVPVIVVSAGGDDLDRVLSLKLGADDHLVRPYNARLLTARIEAVVRRARSLWAPLVPTAGNVTALREHAGSVRELDSLRIDMRRRRVYVGDREAALTRKEFDVLAVLSSDPGKVFSRESIMLEVWGHDGAGDTRTLGVHMTGLRKKLGLPAVIETVRGVGFRLVS
jgi:DNA-binding response OmpR family regulator